MDAAHVQRNSLRGIRYELDHMSESYFIWRPYVDCAAEARTIPDAERELMSAPSPLIYMTIGEWCYTDRVTRKFGYMQPVPTASPVDRHPDYHVACRRWPRSLQDMVREWESRHNQTLRAAGYRSSRRPSCTDDYYEWYDRVTRRFMVNPRIWRDQYGFQGSQGHFPVAVSFPVFLFKH